MKTMMADRIGPVLIPSPGRDDSAPVLTRPWVLSPTAAPTAACPAVPAPALEPAPIERAADNCIECAQEESHFDPPAQQDPTRASRQQARGDAADLARLACQIRHSHEQHVQSVRTNLEHALELGQ